MAKRKPNPPRQEKPWPDFPLNWQARGYWRCVRGGREYRYSADWQEAYQAYIRDESAREKGREPPSQPRVRYTLRDAINLFMTRQTDRFKEGKIGDVQYTKYRIELAGNPKAEPPVLSMLFRAPPDSDDFRDLPAITPELPLEKLSGREGPMYFRAIRKKALARGLSAAERHMTYVRAMLDYVAKKGLMLPPHYGDEFDKPTQGQILHAQEDREEEMGERAWSLPELRRIVAEAQRRTIAKRGNLRNRNLYAQILLALNCAYGSSDCSALPEKAWLREQHMIKFPRVKGAKLRPKRKRLCPLWPVTEEALSEAMSHRPEARQEQHAKRIFLTSAGNPYVVRSAARDEQGRPTKVGRTDSINLAFKRLLKRLGLLRKGAGFYTLRAMSRSLMLGSGADRDLVAVIMGRRFQYPVDEYYLRADLRTKLVAAVEHMRKELFEEKSTAPETPVK